MQTGEDEGFVPPEVHHHLPHLLQVKLQAVLITPVLKSAQQVPLLIFLSLLYTTNYGRVIWEFL